MSNSNPNIKGLECVNVEAIEMFEEGDPSDTERFKTYNFSFSTFFSFIFGANPTLKISFLVESFVGWKLMETNINVGD